MSTKKPHGVKSRGKLEVEVKLFVGSRVEAEVEVEL
jgi:hypothetical protein